MLRTALHLTAGFVLLATPLTGQNYTGTYAATNDQGGQTVMTLRQGNSGQLTGTISGNGTTLQIEGVLEDGSVVGAMTGPQGGLWFEAELDEGDLYVTLVEPDANGQPNYSTASTIILSRASAAAQGAAAGANPLASGATATGTQDPWIGAFSDGSVLLQLQGGGGNYSGTVQVQGQSFPVSLSGSASSLQGSFRTGDGDYAMELAQQGGGVVMATGGTTYTLQRAGGAAAANPLAAGGGGAAYGQQQGAGNQGYGAQPMTGAGGGSLHDGSQVGREWAEFLVNKKATQMDSYSSGSAGGYSSRTDVHFCANGQFALSGNSMVSADVGGVSGYNGGNSQGSGTWRIITEGQVAGIELRYSNGGVEQYRLDYQDGATYVNGDRWYVTPSEACGY
jgi:hypothetical protein